MFNILSGALFFLSPSIFMFNILSVHCFYKEKSEVQEQLESFQSQVLCQQNNIKNAINKNKVGERTLVFFRRDLLSSISYARIPNHFRLRGALF